MTTKTKDKDLDAWIELVYQDKDGIDWAKDRLIEDKINDILESVGIKCIHGNCETGSGITLDSNERDIVFEVPADKKEAAIKAIKESFEKMKIKRSDLKVSSGVFEKLEEGGPIQPIGNPLIGDNFFFYNPTKILGEQEIKKGRFDNDIVVVKGSLSDLDKIYVLDPAKPKEEVTEIFTSKSKEQVIDEVFETEAKKAVESIYKRYEVVEGDIGAEAAIQDQASYSIRETAKMYNKGITQDEVIAYFFTNPDLPWENLLDESPEGKQKELLDKGLIAYYNHGGDKFQYKYTYQSGDISLKIRVLNVPEKKAEIIEKFGQEQWDKQLALLEAVRPEKKKFSTSDNEDDVIILLPHSKFAKENMITELRYGKPELYGETSLFAAFKSWLRELPPDEFKKTNSYELIKYYLNGDPVKISRSGSKEDIAKQEKNAVSIRQRTKEEGDLLFKRFLGNELTIEDQAKLSHLWNEKFNSLVEPNFSKIPIGFRISKTFKADAPFLLTPSQRQAVAFLMEKRSGLLAYGVGVGKTAAAIAYISQAIDYGLSKKPMLVVPTNTYGKWMAELQGEENKDTGKFMHGLLPHLPPIVGLFNLNPIMMRRELKIYTEDETAKLEGLENAIELIGNLPKLYDFTDDKKNQAFVKIYPFNIEMLTAAYSEYILVFKGKIPKTKVEFVLQHAKNEFNQLIYQLGTIKEFPDGTVFVTTEQGIQRLGLNQENQDRISSRLFKILSQGEDTGGSGREKERAKLEIKIEQTLASSLKKAKVNIEEFGIDLATFDESHFYKKIFTYVRGDIKEGEYTPSGKQRRETAKYEIKSGQFPSSRALSAFVISQYIQMANENRNVVHLTATPFTNSPLEVYSMLALTNYKMLEDLGLDNMTDFFDTFMKITYDIKYTPQKTVVKDEVLTGFNNLPQLRKLIYSIMDYKTGEDAGINRPEKIEFPSFRDGRETSMKMTSQQTEYMRDIKSYIQGDASYEEICTLALEEELEEADYEAYPDEELINVWEKHTNGEFEGVRELADAKRQMMIGQIKKAFMGMVQFGEDELDEEESLAIRLLKAISMMRQISLSPYLYSCKKQAAIKPTYKQYIETSPKLRYIVGCIETIKKYHEKNKEPLSGQVIYMNAGVHFFPLIKEYLVKVVGFKDGEVGFVTGKMSTGAKESAKKDFLSGAMKVLIGSSTISVGVDLQTNATALFNAYFDWNPTDAQQIAGRIWRQGNHFNKVRIVYPVLANSADPVIFQYLEEKTLRIKEIWDRDGKSSELDLKDFNPQELKYKLITDPEEKADLDILRETDKLNEEVIYYENRLESLRNISMDFERYTDLKPEVIRLLTEYSIKKGTEDKQEALQLVRDKKIALLDEFGDNRKKYNSEIKKLKATTWFGYDHDKDPDKSYTGIKYTKKDDEEVYSAARKYMDFLDKLTYADDYWETENYNSQSIINTLQSWRTSYIEIKRARERILEPLGLDPNDLSSPIETVSAKVTEMKTREDDILASRAERIQKYKIEEVKNTKHIKTVDFRIQEFASMNHILSEKIIIEEPKEPAKPKKELITSRIKALGIISKRRKGKEKELIEKRLKGLKIIQKRMK